MQQVIIWANVDQVMCRYMASLGQIEIITEINKTSIDPDSRIHGANMGPAWVLSAPDKPHVGPWTLLSGEFMAWVGNYIHGDYMIGMGCTVKPVCNGHLYNKINSLWFSQ